MKKLLLFSLLACLPFLKLNAQTKYGRITPHPLDSVTSANQATPALADIDNDGDLDLFIGQQGLNKMKYYENTGTPTIPIYEEKIGNENPLDIYGNNSGCNAPTLVDIDGDDDLDAFVGIWAKTIKYYENTGDKNSPIFTPRIGETNPLDTVLMPSSCVYPAFMDMDGDNDYDVIVTDQAGNINYYENTGTPLAPVFVENTTDNPLSGLNYSSRIKIIFHDVDGDGLKDAIVGNDLDNTVDYYTNEGTLQNPIFTMVLTENNPFSNVAGSSGVAPQVGDLDGDGKVELVIGVLKTVFIYSEYVYIPDANFKAALLANNTINSVDDGGISFAEAEAFTGIIDVSDLNIDDLTGIEAFINLTQLKISGNNLISLDLTKNTKLTSITALNNQLTTINLTGLTQLTYLNLTSSSLTDIDLSTLTALQSLFLTNNKLTSIDISKNTDLSTLSVPLMDLTTIDVTMLTALKNLQIQVNEITAIDLSNNLLLENLDAGGNLLAELDISANTKLTQISLDANKIETLDLSTNVSLLKVEVRNNPNLVSLNVKNGNNTNFTLFQANNTPNLDCIQVDDSTYSVDNWTVVDEGVSFSTDCGSVTGLNEFELQVGQLYPNPTSSQLIVKLTSDANYSIINILGEIVAEGTLTTGTNNLNVANLTKGTYSLLLQGAYSSRFVKR